MNGKKFVECEIIRCDARKNIFVAEKKFVSVEKFFELRLNGEHFKKIFCSPENLEDLAVGVLAQSEKISSAENISRLEIVGSTIEVEINFDAQPAPKIFS